MALGVNLGSEEDWVPAVLRGQVAEERRVATPRPWPGNGWGSTLGVLEPRHCANLWPDVSLIPERSLQLSLRKGHLPQGLVNEYNFTATKEAPRTESSGGKTVPPFFPGRVAKVAAFAPQTRPQAPGWVQAQLWQPSSRPRSRRWLSFRSWTSWFRIPFSSDITRAFSVPRPARSSGGALNCPAAAMRDQDTALVVHVGLRELWTC